MKSGEYSLTISEISGEGECREHAVLTVIGATVPLAAFRLPTKASVKFRGLESHR